MKSIPAALCASVALLVSAALAHKACADGSKTFVMRPRLGAAQLNLPSVVSWTSAANAAGGYHVTLKAETDVRSVIANIKSLSAKALDRTGKCSDTVKVLNAAAKLTGTRSLRYDLRFHYVKRVCAGGYPLELPADVDCTANIALAAQRSVIVIDVRGATATPCKIEGAYQGVSDAVYAVVGVDVFKRHAIDLARHLPPEFKGMSIEVKSLAFDLPPAAAKLRIAGESTMTSAQFAQFMARIETIAPKAKQ